MEQDGITKLRGEGRSGDGTGQAGPVPVVPWNWTEEVRYEEKRARGHLPALGQAQAPCKAAGGFPATFHTRWSQRVFSSELAFHGDGYKRGN